MYQSHSWRLVLAGDSEEYIKTECDSLIKRLSTGELRAGWTYEIAAVDGVINVTAK